MTTVKVIIASLVSVSGAILAWLKFFREKPVKKTDIFKAVQGNHEINMILADVANRVENVVKAGIIETTNGGGIPQAGRVTYKRVIASTDPSIFVQFGEKTPNDATYNKIILDTLINGETMWYTKDMKDPMVMDLFQSTGITNGLVFMLRVEDGVRLVAFVVDFKEKHEPDATEMYYLRDARQKIKSILLRR